MIKKSMKILYILLLPYFMISCQTMKFEVSEQESWQEFQNIAGKVVEIIVSTETYPSETTDTIVQKENHHYFFNNRNKIIKRIDLYNNAIQPDTTRFSYQKNLLISSNFNNANINSTSYFLYDKNKNLTKKKIKTNNEFVLETDFIYDHNKNLTEIISNSIKNKTLITEKFLIDYKNRIVEILTFKNHIKDNNITLKKHFNKKGQPEKIEFIYNDEKNKNYSWYSLITYDKSGNIMCRNSYYYSGKPYNSSCYEYTYDKLGNVISSEMTFNNKLLEKSTYQIIYR